MAEYSGKSLYMDFDGVELTADFKSLDVSNGTKTADSTAGADTEESHVVLTKSTTFDISLLDNDSAAGLAIRQALANGKQGVFTYGPQGNAVGKPKFSCNATVTSASDKNPADGLVELKVTLTKNGDWIANADQTPTDTFTV